MIETNNLTKIFRTEEVETTALSEIRLAISEGEFVAVTGPSGCGKTTLLNILGLLDTPSSGEYRLFDFDVSKCPERRRVALRKGNIGFVFQSFNLIDELTVFENVELPLVYQRLAVRERRERVDGLLEQLTLASRRNHYPKQLSGGQQQRVAVARAVVTNPKLILADEPTGNLDSKHGDDIMSVLADLNSDGTTIVMVTHSAAYARYARRKVNLFDGKIMAEQRLGVRHA